MDPGGRPINGGLAAEYVPAGGRTDVSAAARGEDDFRMRAAHRGMVNGSLEDPIRR